MTATRSASRPISRSPSATGCASARPPSSSSCHGTRSSSGGRPAAPVTSQVLAANVDLALIVHGLDRPLNTRRLQRFSAIAWDGGVEPVVVLAKTDLVDDVAAEVRAAERALPGVPVFALSVHDGSGVDGVLRLAAPERDARPRRRSPARASPPSRTC